jgi:hypothetical protein
MTAEEHIKKMIGDLVAELCVLRAQLEATRLELEATRAKLKELEHV